VNTQKQHIRRKRRKRGNALVELALTIPVLLTICIGASDFGRLFYHVITLVDAANAGAAHGAFRSFNSGDFSMIESIAQQAANDVSRSGSVTATASRFCDCPGAAADGPDDENAVSCFTGTCGTYGGPRVYVRVEVEQAFSTFAEYPGIDKTRTLSPAAYRRVQ
jgi:TadE-like protein